MYRECVRLTYLVEFFDDDANHYVENKKGAHLRTTGKAYFKHHNTLGVKQNVISLSQ